VAVRTAGDTATLILLGDLVEGADRQSRVLGDSVDRLAASGKRLIVLDLCAVRCVDAMGIGQLANAYLRARAHHADLKLYRPRPELEHLLAVTKLQTIIEVCRTDDPTLDEASRQGRRDASFYGTDTTHYASLQLLSVPA
jgi:anti-anti-sigma factor